MRLERVSAMYLGLAPDSRRDAEAGGRVLGAGRPGRDGWMWLRMAAASTSDSSLHRRKRALAGFYANYLMPEILALERQAQCGSASLDALDVEALAGDLR